MIKFEGLYWAQGWKDIFNPNYRITEHPTLVFYDETTKQYYFINLTSNNDTRKIDLLPGKNGIVRIKAKMVRYKGKIYDEYLMSITRYVARVDADYVDTKDKMSLLGGVMIDKPYRCSNYNEIIKFIFKVISYNLRKDKTILTCYNGNNSTEYSGLKDPVIPLKLREFIHSIARSS